MGTARKGRGKALPLVGRLEWARHPFLAREMGEPVLTSPDRNGAGPRPVARIARGTPAMVGTLLVSLRAAPWEIHFGLALLLGVHVRLRL